MSTRYDEPNRTARAANTVIRWLAELGISIAGTRALRVRGRKTGKQRGVVINLLTVDGVDYVVSPRGNTQWARNVRAAGVVESGTALAQRTRAGISEVADDAKPELLQALSGQVVLAGQGLRRRVDAGIQRRRVARRRTLHPGIRAACGYPLSVSRAYPVPARSALACSEMLPPGHRRRQIAPHAVEDSDDLGAAPRWVPCTPVHPSRPSG